MQLPCSVGISDLSSNSPEQRNTVDGEEGDTVLGF